MLGKIRIGVIVCFAALTGVFAASQIPHNLSGEIASVETFQSGAKLFEENCARCHGADGKGGKGPNLASEKRQAKWRESDAKLVRKITKGGLFMPSFGKKLKPEDIKLIAEHVRTLKE